MTILTLFLENLKPVDAEVKKHLDVSKNAQCLQNENYLVTYDNNISDDGHSVTMQDLAHNSKHVIPYYLHCKAEGTSFAETQCPEGSENCYQLECNIHEFL